MKQNRFFNIIALATLLLAVHNTAWAQDTYSIKKTFFSGFNYDQEPVSSDDTYFYYAAGTVITLTPTNEHKVITSVTPATLSSVIASNMRSVTITMPAKNVESGQINTATAYAVTMPEGFSLSASGNSQVFYHEGTVYYCKYVTEYYWYSIVAPYGYAITSATYDGNAATTSGQGNIGFYLKQKDATVTAEATDCFSIGNGADGTEGHPYVITTADGLTLLTTYTSNQTSGKYFELGAEIAYTPSGAENENNFNGIQSFSGTFDGHGHVISGIRIHQNGTYHGLFKRINGGTVKNVVLDDARIYAPSKVGGIVGEIISGAIQNCLVLNSVITETSYDNYKGAIAGDYSNISGCSNNFYHNCTVNGNNTFVGVYSSDHAWACGGYIITLPNGVSAASGKSLTVGGTTYHGSYENTVTLTYDDLPNGKAALFTVTKTGDASLVAETAATFTMPEADVSVSTELCDIYTLALPDGVSADGHSVTVGSDTYYLGGSTVTLSYPALSEGYAVVYSVNGSPIAGNTFTITANTAVTTAPTDVWGIAGGADGTSEATAYVITTTAGLDLLANKVDGAGGYSQNYYENKYFKLGNDITYSNTTDWNATASTEENFTPIGNTKFFRGTFDGGGHTVSGIRVYRGGNNSTSYDSYLGLFGRTAGIVKNVTVSDARITGFRYVGGVVGYNVGTVENCQAAGTVAIHAVTNVARFHGGIVGSNENNSSVVSGCTSAATLSMADGINCLNIGGIVGRNVGHIEDCLALGAAVSGTSYFGAIVGSTNNNLSNNYYSGCSVNGTPNATYVGLGGAYSPSDLPEGACGIGRITLSGNATVTGSTVTIGSVDYYFASQDVTLGHGDAPAGYGDFLGYTVKDANDNDVAVFEDAGDYTFEMPAGDVTVSATFLSLALTLTQGTKDGITAYWGSFYSGTHRYTLPEGAAAYTMGTDYQLYRLGSDGRTIPDGVAVVIIATIADVALTPDDGLSPVEDHATGGNQLHGSNTAVAVGGLSGTPYVLSVSGGVIGFRQFTGASIPAGKAYYVVVTP